MSSRVDVQQVLGLRRGRRILLFLIAFIAVALVVLDGTQEDPWLPHDLSRFPQLPSLAQYTGQHQSDLLIDNEPVSPLPSRILVTGGGGNVGKRLIRRLLHAGIPVTCIDNIFLADELKGIHRDLPQAAELLRVIHGDIRNATALDSALTTDVSGVIHLAAVSRVLWCLENADDCYDVNVQAVDTVLNAMKRHGGQPWFIQASSREVYGSQDVLPVQEDALITPANIYGETKAKAEAVILRHTAERNEDRSEPDLQSIALRLSNVYGGEYDHRERLIPAIMTQAIAHRTIQVVGGSQNLDMVHIDDVADAFMMAVARLETRKLSGWSRWSLSQRKSNYEAFNIASGHSAPVDELLGKILAITQSSSPLQTIAGDDRFPDHYVGSTAKASSVLGYTARVTLDDGIHRLATAYMKRTADFLDSKIDDECSGGAPYGVGDLLNLDGCTGTIATGDTDKTGYLYWTDGVFGWRDDLEPHFWNFEVELHDEVPVFRFFREDSDGGLRYFQVPEDGGEGETRFRVRVDPSTGYVAITTAASDRPIDAPEINMQQGLFRRAAPLEHRFRLTPYCCLGKPAPWPFYAEDPLASAIFDHRTEKERDFTASRVRTSCDRLRAARATLQRKLDNLAAYPLPISLEQAPIPTGKPSEWRQRALPVCANLCDHPTVCLDTGDCMCGQSSCVPPVRFPFASSAHLEALSYPPTTSDENRLQDPGVLVAQVSVSSWLNVLRQPMARYLGRGAEMMPIHVTRLPDDVQKDRDENPDVYDRVHSSRWGCFSADSTLERAAKLVGGEYTNDSLVFLPFYQGLKNAPPVDQWLDNALQHHLPSDFDQSHLVIPFTYDWGVCNYGGIRSLFDMRNRDGHAPDAIHHGTAWSVMGDLNSNCYRPDQDIVIPPRTCLQDQLREQFGDMSKVRPVRQRSVLTFFKGRAAGVGGTLRPKLQCAREQRATSEPALTGGLEMPAIFGTYPEGMDYLETLNDTVFCPLPAGTTGWATRTIDAIYAGCIPVLIGDSTLQPFWDSLDWAKFSVPVAVEDLDRLEELLLSYSWAELHRLQTNLMLIREAFLYPLEGDMGQQLRVRGPFFFAMHGTALLRQTKFPV